MPHLTLSFAQPFIDVPREVGQELFQRMNEVLSSLNAIPRGSAIWESLATSWLVLEMRDWRFHYRIDSDSDRLIVMTAARREESNAG